MKYFFLVRTNEFEGGVPASMTVARIASVCRDTGCEHSVFLSGFPGEEEEFVRHLVGRHLNFPIRVIVCGALEDLHFAVNGAVGAPGIEIGYWPRDDEDLFSGSFSSGIDEVRTSAENPFPGKSVDIDLIKVNDRYCVGGAVFGSDPRIETIRRRLHALKKRFSTFRIPENTCLLHNRAIMSLLHSSAKKIHFRINGHETFEEYLLYVLCANVRKPAEGYPTISGARADDGLIDALFVKKIPFRLRPNFESDSFFHEQSDDERIRDCIKYRKCIAIEVDFAEPSVIVMDGTHYLCDSHFNIVTRPAALKMLIPDQNIKTIREK